ASELELDGFRRLRKADLVDRILEVHGAGEEAAQVAEPVAEEKAKRARRARRTRDADTCEEAAAEEAAELEAAEPEAAEPEAVEPEAVAEPAAVEPRGATVEGVVELLGNGSGFVRVNPPEASDDDVYIS